MMSEDYHRKGRGSIYNKWFKLAMLEVLHDFSAQQDKI